MKKYKIAYALKFRHDGSVFGDPYAVAYMDGSTPEEALANLENEFPMFKVDATRIAEHIDVA